MMEQKGYLNIEPTRNIGEWKAVKKIAEEKKLKEILLCHGQYRDVDYIGADGTAEMERCLVVPAIFIEPLLKADKEKKS